MLVIENGSVVPGADSFVSDVQFAEYAGKFGADLPQDESAREALLRQAAVQMASLPWQGRLVSIDQDLCWPRAGVRREGFELPSDAIPQLVKSGQMELAISLHRDAVARAGAEEQRIKQETVDDAVTVVYADPKAAALEGVTVPRWQSLLAPLLSAGTRTRVLRG